jgi:type I restriction enzyme S subunit
VLINSTGVGTLGRVAQVLQDIKDCTVDSHVTIVRPSESVDADFLGLQLFELQGHFESLGQGATGQTELGREAIANTDFIAASKDIQEKFSATVKPMRGLVVWLLEKNENLRQTRDLLLPKLISGEVEV